MTPTQAQIDAAVTAFKSATGYYGRKFDIGMKAALTAAAEVEPKDTSGVDMVEQIVATTIERCAQVAERAASNFPDTMRREIAATVRALKVERS